jgi:hypothetical protein
MLDTLARSHIFPAWRLPKWHRPSASLFYASIAVLALSIACGSSLEIHQRLQRSHLIEAYYSRMVENPNPVPLPAHFPVFVAATTTGKIELIGLSICNFTAYHPGERTELWLDPANPRVVTPNRIVDVWFFPLLMVFAAAGFSIFALLVQKPHRSSKTSIDNPVKAA